MVFKTQPLDEIDIRILEYIGDNPACGIGDVTRETKEYGLQNATIRYRVNKLSRQGFIRLDKVLERYYLLYHTDKTVRFLKLKKNHPEKMSSEEGNTSSSVATMALSPSSCTPTTTGTNASTHSVIRRRQDE